MSNPIREVQGEWLGPLLQKERELLGLSLNKAAQAANLAPSTVMRIENGSMDNPSLETLYRLCLVYEVEPSEVIPPIGSVRVALARFQDQTAD